MGLATFNQVRLMRKLGIPRPHSISFHRAVEIIDRYCARRTVEAMETHPSDMLTLKTQKNQSCSIRCGKLPAKRSEHEAL
jgi:hypothetical protein